MSNHDDLQKSDQSFANANQMLQQVLNTIHVRVFWKDLDGYYLGSNIRFAQDAGFQSPDELIGKNDFDLVWHKEAELYRADDQLVIQTGQEKLNYEEPQTTPDNQIIWLRTSKIPFRNKDGEIIGILGTYEDITERKQIEQERNDLISDLEAQKSELERYAYTVSHDLKSPLITIKGFLGLLEKDAIEGTIDNVKQDAIVINNAVDKMSALLEDLLHLSRVGRVINSPENVSFSILAHEAVQLVQNQITARRVEVTISLDDVMIFVDPLRIREVLQNLIENAVKFMGDQEKPHIEIGTIPEDMFVVCYVKDNGIGIDSPYQEKVFDLFERLDQHIEGTGVGLAIVKRVVESHNGHVWVESTEKTQGSTFFFTLPAAQANKII